MRLLVTQTRSWFKFPIAFGRLSTSQTGAIVEACTGTPSHISWCKRHAVTFRLTDISSTLQCLKCPTFTHTSLSSFDSCGVYKLMTLGFMLQCPCFAGKRSGRGTLSVSRPNFSFLLPPAIPDRQFSPSPFFSICLLPSALPPHQSLHYPSCLVSCPPCFGFDVVAVTVPKSGGY